MKQFNKLVLLSMMALFIGVALFSLAQSRGAQVTASAVSYGDFLREELPEFVAGQESFRLERTVGRGVQFVTEFHKEGPLFINCIIVDLGAQGIGLEAEKGRDLLFAGERVQEIARRESYDGHYVIAAVNGDFWTTRYRPTGLFVDDGRIYDSPSTNRPVFVFTASGEPFIGRFDFSATLETSAGSTPIDGINFPGRQKDLVLFTAVSGDMTPDSESRTEIVLEMQTEEFLPNRDYQGAVVSIKKDSGLTPLGARRWVLSAARKKKDVLEQSLKPGDSVKIRATLGGISEPVAFVMGGGPLLVRNGAVDVDGKRDAVSQGFITTRHPRTAIGYSRDKRTLFLVTVDGRQPIISIGINLNQLADYMKALGAYDAMNLDGGGSTTMWVRGAVVNKPSDVTGPRIVTNALLLVTQSAQGPLAHLDISPRSLHLPITTSARFSVIGTDENYNAVPLDTKSLNWYATEGIGSISSEGLLHTAEKPAEGSVMARVAEPRAFGSVPVKVDAVARVEVEPSPLMLREQESARLRIRAFDAGNSRLFLPPESIRLDAPQHLAWSLQDSMMRAVEKGRGEFSVAVGGSRVSVPYTVGIFDTRLIEGFDRLPEGGEKTWLSGENYDANQTHLSINEREKKEGAGSLRLAYAMKRGGETSISLNLKALIAATPSRIGLWVYGDGKGHWLRGEAKDNDGELFIMDFTRASKGIYWDSEWRYIEIDQSGIIPKWTNPRAHIDYPVTLLRLYLSQAQEAAKTDGSILLDSLEAIYFPSQ